jgi:hypothetical protein
MSECTLQIREFDPRAIEDRRVCLVIGKRNTGKSVLVKDLMYHKRHFPMGVVMSGTELVNGWYGKWVPDSFIYNDFDKKVIESILERQRRLSKRNKAKNVFMVIDDCLYNKKLLHEKCMREVFMNGRHYMLHLWLTAQYIMDVPPDIRTQIDYVFVLKENNVQNRKRLYDTFFGMFPSFDTFCQVLDRCTENYECLVLDQVTRSNKIEDQVFWYKARVRDNFRMGSPLFWRFHSNNYDPEHDERGALPLMTHRAKHRVLVTKETRDK